MLLVEQKVSRSLPILHGQGGQSLTFSMRSDHLSQINSADHIHVMNDEWLFSGISQKEIGGLLQPTPGIEQDLLARYFNPHAKVSVLFQILNNHLSSVMHINNDLVNPKGAQARECDL